MGLKSDQNEVFNLLLEITKFSHHLFFVSLISVIKKNQKKKTPNIKQTRTVDSFQAHFAVKLTNL